MKLVHVAADLAAMRDREVAHARIAAAIRRAAHGRSRAAVIVAQAPDQDGHGADALARVLADWERWSRERARCAPLGAARHALAIAPIGFESHAVDACEQIARAIDARPCRLERSAAPRVFFGLALFPDDGVEAAQLLTRAERALESAIAAQRASTSRPAARSTSVEVSALDA